MTVFEIYIMLMLGNAISVAALFLIVKLGYMRGMA